MKKILLSTLFVLLLASCSRNSIRVDNDAPVITIDTYEETFYIGGEVPYFTASCQDDVDEMCTVTTPNYPDVSRPGTHTITFKATDQAGNSVYETITITSIDRSSYITLNIGDYLDTVEVGDHYNLPVVSCTSTQSDVCVVSMVTSLDTTTPNDSYQLEITGTDSESNAKTVVLDIVIEDTVAPEIELLGEESYTVEYSDTDWVDPGVSTFDETEVTVTSVFEPDPTINPLGTFTITYTATDTTGNTSTTTRTVTVEDTTAPTLLLNGDAAVTVELGDTWEDPGLTITDMQTTTTVTDVTPNTDLVGEYLITYTVTDASNNESTITRTVTVEDSTAPIVIIAGPDEITVELGDAWPTLEVSTIEISSGEVIVSTMDPVYDNMVGVFVQTVTSTDASNNVGSASRTVNVVDTTNPTITLVGDATVNLNAGDAWTDPGVTTDDLSTVTVTQDVTPDLNTPGVYIITYTAEDSSGNTSTVQRTVNVN